MVYNGRIPKTEAGNRVDRVLVALFSNFSRSVIQRCLRQGAVTVNGNCVKASQKIVGNEWVQLNITTESDNCWRAEPGSLHICYEDDDLMVVDKPVSLVVHPGAGNPTGTLINRLLAHRPELSSLPRCGIVHRLDKDTSGLLIVATSLRACAALSDALQQRRIERYYQALVYGLVTAGRTINAAIGRDPYRRTQMAVVNNGREAITYIQSCEHFRMHSLVRIRLGSGRTHQIRVHLAHIGYPLVGDMIYNTKRLALPRHLHPLLEAQLNAFDHQMLHAFELGFEHPFSNEWMSFTSSLPTDMMALLETLRSDHKNHLPAPL